MCGARGRRMMPFRFATVLAQPAVVLIDQVIDARDVGVDRFGVFTHHPLGVIGGGHRVARGLLRCDRRRLGAVGSGVGARRLKLRLLGRSIRRRAADAGQQQRQQGKTTSLK